MNEQQKILDTLLSLPLFQVCDEETLRTLAGRARIVRAEKGKVLFLSDDEAQAFYIVLSGWVKLYRETIDGTQAIVDIMTTGHMVGETSIFESGRYVSSAEVADECVYIRLPIDFLAREVKSNSDFAFAMLSSMARYRKQQDKEIEHRTIQNASQRIGCFLLRLVDPKHEGPVVVTLPYDKTLVASRLGMQPETFSRALSKLKTITGIRVKGAQIEMDGVDALVSYSCSACSTEFPCQGTE